VCKGKIWYEDGREKSASGGRTDVKPVNKKHARQNSLSEQQAPKGLII
jgi:hypothetical protein